ncbi:hypothetical protein ACWCPG_33870, partial [Streptomyces sp. NPDC001919]
MSVDRGSGSGPPLIDRPFLRRNHGARRAGPEPAGRSGGRRRRPEIIMVTPSYMLTLLDEFERQGVDPRS